MNEIQQQRFADALTRLSGDVETLQMLATMASEDAPVLLKKIDNAIAEKDAIALGKLLHSLKGLLSTFVTSEPVSELHPIKEATDNGDMDEAQMRYEQLRPGLQNLVEEIKGLSKSPRA